MFTSWPSRGRRAHTGAQPTQKSDISEYVHDNAPLRREKEDQSRREQEFSLRKLAPKDTNAPKQPPRKAVDEERKTLHSSWEGFSSVYGVRIDPANTSTEASSEPAFEKEFHRKYEEIWGIGQIPPSNVLRAHVKKESNEEESSRDASALFSGLRRIELWGKRLPPRIRKAWLVKSRRDGTHQCQVTRKFRATQMQPSKGARGQPAKAENTGEYPARDESGFRGVRRVDERVRKLWIEKNNVGSTTEKEDARQSPAHLKTRTAINCHHSHQKRPLRTKSPRQTPGRRYNPAFTWRARFSMLYLLRKGIVKDQKPLDKVGFRIATSIQALQEDLIKADSSTSLRKIWEALPLDKRKEIWPDLMILTLKNNPTKALKFLAATYMDPFPSAYAVGDSLDYIISYYLDDRKARNTKNALEIFRVIENILRLGPPHYFCIAQNSVYLLLKNLDDAFSGILFQVLTKHGQQLHKNTLMHFPSRLRLSGGADERIELLQRLRLEGGDFNSPEIMSVCTTLLQRKNRTSEATFSDSEVFEYMLECGMMPNIVIYNVLLQNALEASDHETAWQIHDMMVDNGIETDAYTYSLLLSDAKLRDDRPSVERVIRTVSRKGIRNAHIVTDLLHTIFIFRQHAMVPNHENQGRPSKTFERMLLVYRQYFHLEPLARLIPWFEDSYPNTTSISNETLMDAPVPTLVVMLTALFRQLSEPGSVVRFYQHFCDLVQAGDPVATALSESTHVFNVILKGLGRFPESLAFCPRLIGDMLSQNTVAASGARENQVYRPVHNDSVKWNMPTQSQALPEASKTLPCAGSDENESTPQVFRPDSVSWNNSYGDQALSETSETLPYTGTDENRGSPQVYRPTHDDSVGLNISAHSQVPSETPTSPISTATFPTSQRRLFPKPDVYTWSVLLKAFMDHGQPRAAEKVLTMMEERGVWPNQVTWSSLMIGYARMQDMSMTVDAVNRLQRSGFNLDMITMKGLAYFRNRRALIEALKASEASDPGRSSKKRPAAIGVARTALNQTLRMADGRKSIGLEPVIEVAEAADDTEKIDNLGYGDVSSRGHPKGEHEFVVGDIQRTEDEVV